MLEMCVVSFETGCARYRDAVRPIYLVAEMATVQMLES